MRSDSPQWTRPILHSAILTAQGLETIQMLLDHAADVQAVARLKNIQQVGFAVGQCGCRADPPAA